MSNRAVQWTRVLVEVTEDFDPSASNSLLQWMPYDVAFPLLGAAGTKVALVFGLYDQGDDSGKFYHGTRRPPIYDVSTVTRFVGKFVAWFDTLEDKPEIAAWSVGNEVEFDRTGTYTFSKWWNAWNAARPLMPPNAMRLSSGNSLYFNQNPNNPNSPRTLAGELAHSGKAVQHDIVLVAHFNGEPWDKMFQEMRDIPDRFQGVKVACDEDRSPYRADHSDALRRGKEVERAGGLLYGPFTARCTTDLENSPKQHHVCTWNANGSTSSQHRRGNLAFEGCFREWKPDNYSQAKALAQHLGIWIPGPDLPVNIQGGPPVATIPNGLHQLCAILNRAFLIAGLPAPGTENLKRDAGSNASGSNSIANLTRVLKSKWKLPDDEVPLPPLD